MMVLSEVYKNMIKEFSDTVGIEINKEVDIFVNLSRSTIRRFRNKTREEIANKYREETKTINVKIIVQWDGKQYKENNEKVERIAVLVVGNGIDRLLGVAKLHRATGKNQAETVEKLIKAYGIEDHIVGMCFDTCAVNTGSDNGTCVLLEKSLNKKLLHFACRHHIFELVLKTAFVEVMSIEEVGPDVPLFKNFKSMWCNILDKDNYKSCLDDPEIPKAIKKDKNYFLKIAMEFLKVN